jgi:Bax protein
MAVVSHTPTRLAALPGVIFIAYALLCLALALWLGNRIAPGAGTAVTAEWVEPAAIDFKSISLHKARKQAFFDYFMPLIERHNQRTLQRRQQVLELQAALQEGELSERQLQKLNRLAERYRIKRDIAPARQIELLLPKVDVIPPSMVLAQAAVESAWGTSRFAREANNFFGQWCYEPGCGLVPVKRRSGDNHEVARFESPSDAVDSYFRNINSHSAYAPVRAIRAKQRQQGGQFSGDHLIEGLHSYSTRRGGYIRELRTVMQGNNMGRFDQGFNTEF